MPLQYVDPHMTLSSIRPWWLPTVKLGLLENMDLHRTWLRIITQRYSNSLTSC